MTSKPFVFFAVFLGASQAYSSTEWHDGIECKYVAYNSNAFPDEVQYADWGLELHAYDETENNNWVGAAISCPLSWMGTQTSVSSASTFTMYYRDYNDMTQNTIGTLWCGVSTVDGSGNAYFSAGMHSCSVDGGCPSPDYGFVSTSGNASRLIMPGIDGAWKKVTLLCTVPQEEVYTHVYSRLIGYNLVY